MTPTADTCVRLPAASIGGAQLPEIKLFFIAATPYILKFASIGGAQSPEIKLFFIAATPYILKKSLFVINFSSVYFERTVYLFEVYDARKLMRQRDPAEAHLCIRSLFNIIAEPETASDYKYHG